jgi:hypothetical protein
MVTVVPSAAESRPKYVVISFDNRPSLIIPFARGFARGDAIGMGGGKDDDV